MSGHSRFRTLVGALVAAAVMSLLAVPGQAYAAPVTPSFGPEIDPYVGQEFMTQCDPTAKPGVVAFERILTETYGNRSLGIVRACSVGGNSEHKEGRALDFGFNASVPAEKAQADELLAWLFATDQYGNKDALARRLGLMYVCWNHTMWKSYTHPPGYSATFDCGPDQHTTHIHFSFGWAGAYQQTSWWKSRDPVKRIGKLEGTTLSVKEGAIDAGWLPERGDVAKFEIDGNRIGVLTTSGEVVVKEGNLYADWVPQMPGIADFHLAGNRIGVVRTNGSLAVKEGGLDAGWNELIGDVKDFDLTPGRVGVVQTDGNALVKEGGLGAGWVPEMPGIADIELAGNWIALKRTNTSLTLKEGDLNAGWNELIGDVKAFDITPNRVGVVQTDGNALVKEGVNGSWVPEMSGIADIELGGDRIALIRTNRTLPVKEGSLYAGWTEHGNNVVQADLTEY